jgi:hypothetical protein
MRSCDRVIVVQHDRFVASDIRIDSSVRAVGVARSWPVFVKSGCVVDLAKWLARDALALFADDWVLKRATLRKFDFPKTRW